MKANITPIAFFQSKISFNTSLLQADFQDALKIQEDKNR